MSNTRKVRIVRQHEPLRVPQHWNAEDRAFVIQLNGQLDEVFAKLGERNGQIEGNPTAEQIVRSATNPQTVEEALVALNVKLSIVNGKLCITYTT